jgi:hypothetical protein
VETSSKSTLTSGRLLLDLSDFHQNIPKHFPRLPEQEKEHATGKGHMLPTPAQAMVKNQHLSKEAHVAQKHSKKLPNNISSITGGFAPLDAAPTRTPYTLADKHEKHKHTFLRAI